MRAYSTGKKVPSRRKIVSFPGSRFLLARGAAQRAFFAALAAARRGTMQQIMDRFAGKIGGISAETAGQRQDWQSVTQAAAIDTADAVADGVEKDLLLAKELFGAATFMGAGKHLAQGRGNGFDGGEGFAVFAQAEVAIELEDRQEPCFRPGPGRPSPKPSRGRKAASMRGLVGAAARSAIQTGRPFLPGASGQVSSPGSVRPMLSWMRASAHGRGQPRPHRTRGDFRRR